MRGELMCTREGGGPYKHCPTPDVLSVLVLQCIEGIAIILKSGEVCRTCTTWLFPGSRSRESASSPLFSRLIDGRVYATDDHPDRCYMNGIDALDIQTPYWIFLGSLQALTCSSTATRSGQEAPRPVFGGLAAGRGGQGP